MTTGSRDGGEERLAPVTPLFGRPDEGADARGGAPAGAPRPAGAPPTDGPWVTGGVPSPAEQPRNAYDRDGWWVDPAEPAAGSAASDAGLSGAGAEPRGPHDRRATAGPRDEASDAARSATPVEPIPFRPLGSRVGEASDAPLPVSGVPGLRRASELSPSAGGDGRGLPWTADETGASAVASVGGRAATKRAPRLRAVVDDAVAADDDAGAAGPSADEQREEAERLLLKKLRGRGLSVSEATANLRGLGIADDIASQVIEAFVDRGYLNDATLAEQLVYSAVSKKAQGRRAIAQALSARGIPRETVDEALAELPDDDEERALEFARTKARSMASLPPDTALRRLVGQLARRGFNGGIAMQAAKQALSEHAGPRFR